MVQFQYVKMIFNTFKELTQENDGQMMCLNTVAKINRFPSLVKGKDRETCQNPSVIVIISSTLSLCAAGDRRQRR